VVAERTAPHVSAGLLDPFLMRLVNQGSYGNLWLWYLHGVLLLLLLY
jgi:hypothetical protein